MIDSRGRPPSSATNSRRETPTWKAPATAGQKSVCIKGRVKTDPMNSVTNDQGNSLSQAIGTDGRNPEFTQWVQEVEATTDPLDKTISGEPRQ
jgi:hypothetical protein